MAFPRLILEAADCVAAFLNHLAAHGRRLLGFFLENLCSRSQIVLDFLGGLVDAEGSPRSPSQLSDWDPAGVCICKALVLGGLFELGVKVVVRNERAPKTPKAPALIEELLGPLCQRPIPRRGLDKRDEVVVR
jgi:hypothetical protein